MTTTSRRLSEKSRPSRNNHTPGRTKGGYCVKHPDSGVACSANPYKGQGLKGQRLASYDRWWTKMFSVNNVKH